MLNRFPTDKRFLNIYTKTIFNYLGPIVLSSSSALKFDTDFSRHQSLGSTQVSGNSVQENMRRRAFKAKTVRRLLTPHANMNTAIRDVFDCSSRKTMRRHIVSGFARTLLFLSQEKSSGVDIGRRSK